MAKGNFDDEIKKGMSKPQQKNAKSSTNDAPGKAPAKGGAFNGVPKATTQAPASMAQAAAPVDTLQALHDASTAHTNALHAHLVSMKG